MRQSGWRRWVKAAIDRGAAAAGMVALAPVFAAVSVGIRATMGGPVVYKAKRGGYAGSVFTLYKFRTMTDERDTRGRLLPDEQRLHGFGRFLRRTSLDELPQLYNLLRGDVSLVGPRPLHSHYLPRYSPEQARRHDVIPGITGWAQVNGRNALTWEQKFALDLWYVDHWDLTLDATILLKTVAVVLGRKGIDGGGAEVSAPEFLGAAAS